MYQIKIIKLVNERRKRILLVKVRNEKTKRNPLINIENSIITKSLISWKKEENVNQRKVR